MKQESLFAPKEIKETCRQCCHSQPWHSPTHDKIFYYCGIRTSGRTDNGLLKIKLKNKACGYFELLRKPEQLGV